RRTEHILPITVKTGPFPDFATDLQAATVAAACTAKGKSVIEETIFEGRWGHIPELRRMGAKISIDRGAAYIEGVSQLSGAPVEAGDIRGAAALALAALGAKGTTKIYGVDHLRRGYENFEDKLIKLGASVKYKFEDMEDMLAVGC
ncbi:MAG: UDP-N-acetylglucosamine 1-carboxyvinyltransferase, partial [Candidatus Dadabacteria bacterium]